MKPLNPTSRGRHSRPGSGLGRAPSVASTTMEFTDTVRRRRMVRSFSERPLPGPRSTGSSTWPCGARRPGTRGLGHGGPPGPGRDVGLLGGDDDRAVAVPLPALAGPAEGTGGRSSSSPTPPPIGPATASPTRRPWPRGPPRRCRPRVAGALLVRRHRISRSPAPPGRRRRRPGRLLLGNFHGEGALTTALGVPRRPALPGDRPHRRTGR